MYDYQRVATSEILYK